MKGYSLYVGLDVHAESISVAVVHGRDGEVKSLGSIPNNWASLGRLLRKVGKLSEMRICYEAGPCGYGLYWQLVEHGADCIVVAPTLIPVRVGDKVKTDRRDAEKLARFLRSGELTAVWVPDREHEALRELVRARVACRSDKRRAQQRVEKLLLRHSKQAPRGATGKKLKSFGEAYLRWLQSVRFEHNPAQQTLEDYKVEALHQMERLQRLDRQIEEAIAQAPKALREVVAGLQALRGVALTTAAAVAIEVGSFERFKNPTKLMAWAGLVPSEHSSGGPGKARRYGITKTGNSNVRRLLVEAAWHYRHPPKLSKKAKLRRRDLGAEIISVADKAEQRLCKRYYRLVEANKPKNKVTTAIARELLGFMWAIATKKTASTQAPKPVKKRAYKLKRAA